MRKALIGIGSNIGDRKQHIDTAIEALNHIPSVKVSRMSPIYETEPWGYVNQAKFFNAVIEVETNLTANTLLEIAGNDIPENKMYIVQMVVSAVHASVDSFYNKSAKDD